MSNWFHRLFNPHCIHCADELDASKYNESVEILKSELEFLRQENRELRSYIMKSSMPVEPIVDTNELKQIKTSTTIPWNVRRQQLERDDRIKANIKDNQLIQQAAKPDINVTEEVIAIEKELESMESKETVNGN